MSRENVIKKVIALLAKTVENGCSEAEAMIAAAKAKQMIDEYDIKDHDLNEQHKFSTYDKKNSRYNYLKRNLSIPIAHFYNCKAIYIGADMVIFGRDSDVIMAQWLIETLEKYINRELRIYINSKGYLDKEDTKAETNGFLIGAINRITERLEALTPTENMESMNALVVVKNAEVEEKYQQFKKATGLEFLPDTLNNTRYCTTEGVEKGKETGDKANFSRAVGNKKGSKVFG